MWRVAIYARETPGRSGRIRLDRQVAGLVSRVARQPDWRHVATFADQSLSGDRPGLSRLFVEAPGNIDLLVVDGYGRLSVNRQELGDMLTHLNAVGVRTMVLPPSPGRRFARAVANIALADMIGEVAC